jgi:UDP-N-acetylmuramoyl-tripeptide--D-alanyl-D-alanine ligase
LTKIILSSVSIDTRTLETDNLFFGIRGPNFNGSQYAEKALESGAAYAVVDDPAYVTEDRIILVKDSVKALQELAIFHRSRFKRPVFALTGSNGKTTTKELINKVLSKSYITHCTQGNYNNHLGVPLTILQIYPQVEIAIIEMGANRVGDIKELCDIANPTHGLITNIGHAHTETFGGIEGVLRGKSELFDHLRKKGGKALVNMSDPRLANMAKRFDDPVKYPTEDLNLISSEPYITLDLEGHVIKTRITGAYNFENIAAAVSVGRFFDVPTADISEAIESYEPDNMRSQVVKKKDYTILLDAYNANPDSMRLALESFSRIDGNKLVILGDMNELENPLEEHEKLGVLISELGMPAVLIGDKIEAAKNTAQNSHWFSTKEQAIDYLTTLNLTGYNILIKASRSSQLETLLEHI